MSQPRYATLYEITERKVLFYGNFCTITVVRDLPKNYALSKEGDILQPTIEEHALPAHHIVRAGKSDYIVLSPELRDILEEPFRDQLLQAGRQIRHWHDAAHIHLRSVKQLTNSIESFLELPWYARVWRALRRTL